MTCATRCLLAGIVVVRIVGGGRGDGGIFPGKADELIVRDGLLGGTPKAGKVDPTDAACKMIYTFGGRLDTEQAM